MPLNSKTKQDTLTSTVGWKIITRSLQLPIIWYLYFLKFATVWELIGNWCTIISSSWYYNIPLLLWIDTSIFVRYGYICPHLQQIAKKCLKVKNDETLKKMYGREYITKKTNTKWNIYLKGEKKICSTIPKSLWHSWEMSNVYSCWNILSLF